MKRLCDEIDHKVLLPLESRRVQVVEEGECVKVAVDGKPRYVFPRNDCALLPIPNTTVEMLAELLTDRLRAELETSGRARRDGHRNGYRGKFRSVGRFSRASRRRVKAADRPHAIRLSLLSDLFARCANVR